MNQFVADTHALLWFLMASPRLGPAAKKAFDEASAGSALILVPSIVLAELQFVNEKLGRPFDFAAIFKQLQSSPQFQLVPFSPEDVLDFIADALVPEMHDRIIVGVARRAGAACITKDSQVMASGLVATLW
jgi:PIN domain nuclease of toxin-antitoxin system